jgi:hypothetical protein
LNITDRISSPINAPIENDSDEQIDEGTNALMGQIHFTDWRNPLERALIQNNTKISEGLMKDGANMNLDGMSHLLLLSMLCDQTVLLLNYNDTLPTVWFPPPCDEDFFEIVLYVGQANILKTLLFIGTDPDRNIEQCGSMALYFTLKKDDETVHKVLNIILS